MAAKYLPIGAKPRNTLSPIARITLGAAGALTVAFGYYTLSEKSDEPINHVIVQSDPWSECIKQTAEQARREKLDFEILADAKCKGLTMAPKSTPA